MQVNGIKGWKAPHIKNGPVPPASDYDDWLARPSNRPRNRPLYWRPENMDGNKIRRVVVMRRQGESWTDCAAAIGRRNTSNLKELIEMLPLELQP